MDPAGVFETLQAAGVAGVVEFLDGPGEPSIVVEPAKLPEVLEFLKENDSLRFDQLSLLSGVPYEDRFECVYHLLSTVLKHDVVLRVRLDAWTRHGYLKFRIFFCKINIICICYINGNFSLTPY